MEETNQEQEIIKSAEELFLAKGFYATSTTEIAKKAGCNQALVHYYFRTKEKLFYRIFIDKFRVFYQILNEEINPEMDFFDMIDYIVESHFNILKENAQIPNFIINELLTNKERRENIIDLMNSEKKRFDLLDYLESKLKHEIDNKRVRPILFLDLIINIGSLNVMTFVSLPLIAEASNMNEDQKEDYLKSRKREICNTIRRSLIP